MLPAQGSSFKCISATKNCLKTRFVILKPWPLKCRKADKRFFAIQNRWKLKVFSANIWDERNISNIRKVKENNKERSKRYFRHFDSDVLNSTTGSINLLCCRYLNPCGQMFLAQREELVELLMKKKNSQVDTYQQNATLKS